MYSPYQLFILENPHVRLVSLVTKMRGKMDSQIELILKILGRLDPSPTLLELITQRLNRVHDIQVLDYLTDEAFRLANEQDVYKWLDKCFPQGEKENIYQWLDRYLHQKVASRLFKINVEYKDKDKFYQEEQKMETFDDTLRSTEEIRKDFPILSRQVHDKPLVYLDSAASSQKPTV